MDQKNQGTQQQTPSHETPAKGGQQAGTHNQPGQSNVKGGQNTGTGNIKK
jgi:hypothetical protein